MGTKTLARMYAGLVKVAKTRWQKELEAGNLGQEELSRLPRGAALANAPVLGPVYTKGARDAMWGPGATDLSPTSLENHRRLNQKIGRTDVGLLGGMHQSIPGVGPATDAMGRVHVDPSAGTFVRRMAEGPVGIAESLLNAKGVPFLSKAKPEDGTLYRSIVAHEGAEKALMHGAGTNEMPTRWTGSHLGGMPQVAEQLGSYRDPAAQEVWKKARSLSEDDQFIASKMRQFGSRMDSPMALGGKQHVALEDALAKYTPVDFTAIGNRVDNASRGLGHGLNVKSKLLSTLEKYVPAVAARLGHADKAALFTKTIGTMMHPTAADPSTLGGFLKGVSSTVRRR